MAIVATLPRVGQNWMRLGTLENCNEMVGPTSVCAVGAGQSIAFAPHLRFSVHWFAQVTQRVRGAGRCRITRPDCAHSGGHRCAYAARFAPKSDAVSDLLDRVTCGLQVQGCAVWGR